MSGHSKWANIRVKKTAIDARRGKIFTRHARLIEIAARENGGDPTTNARLRTAVENARADSVPNTNIERAVKKGTGELKGEAMQEVMYEAFGPGGVAYLIECLTDNRNRTIANVKAALHRHDGRFVENGAVSWMFEQRGVIVIDMHGKSVEELELLAIEAGADDIRVHDGTMEIVTAKTKWGSVRDALKRAGCMIQEAELRFIPTQIVEVNDAAMAKRIVACIEALETDDDVSAVHTNAEIAGE